MEAKTLFNILGGPTKIAKLCGISVPSVSMWRNTGVPTDRLIYLAAEIEKSTKGSVSRKMLFPKNYNTIWPELK
jgi:DNA-binding transcriptional regulator YdaS (Cro superfamily)